MKNGEQGKHNERQIVFNYCNEIDKQELFEKIITSKIYGGW